MPTLHYDWMQNSGMRTGVVRFCHQLSVESIDMLDVGEVDGLAEEEMPVNTLSDMMVLKRNYNFSALKHGAPNLNWNQ